MTLVALGLILTTPFLIAEVRLQGMLHNSDERRVASSV